MVFARTLEPSQLHSNGEAYKTSYGSQTVLKSRGWKGSGSFLFLWFGIFLMVVIMLFNFS